MIDAVTVRMAGTVSPATGYTPKAKKIELGVSVFRVFLWIECRQRGKNTRRQRGCSVGPDNEAVPYWRGCSVGPDNEAEKADNEAVTGSTCCTCYSTA